MIRRENHAGPATRAAEPDGELLTCCSVGIEAADRSGVFFEQTDNMLVSDPKWQPLFDEGKSALPIQPLTGQC